MINDIQEALVLETEFDYDFGHTHTTVNLEKTAKNLIAKGYHKQEWISVEERLPETNRDCLLLLDTEEIVIGYCRRDLHAFVEGGIVLVKDVTHWMPLPGAPKGADNDT